jgi:DNA-binding beta-propeller fold protein YncE
VLTLITAACSTTKVEKLAPPVWPTPPNLPKFQYEYTLRSDLSIKKKDEGLDIKAIITGSADVPKISFGKPFDIAARNGRIIISDTAAAAVYLFLIPEREVLVFGKMAKGRLGKPLGVAISSSGEYYVADVEKRRISVYEESGHFKLPIGGPEDFDRPTDVAVSSDGSRIFVVDAGGVTSMKHRVTAFDAEGKKLFTFGSRGDGDGMFNLPTHIAVAGDGTVYVLDTGNFRVQAFNIDGKFLRSWGGVGIGFGQFARPRGIAVDNDGNIYVTDAKFGNFQIFNPKGQLLLAIGGIQDKDEVGKYLLIAGITVDETNRVYVVDQRFRKVEIIRRLSEEEGKRLMRKGGN